MSDPARDKLVETLRKAVSRTSMMAEGIDPQLDLTLKEIRQKIAGGANETDINNLLKAAEPQLLQADQARNTQATKIRDNLHDLIDLLERIPNHNVPQKQKKDLLNDIDKNWLSLYSWPDLVASFMELADKTFTSANNAPEKKSLFGRFFPRNTAKNSQQNNANILLDVTYTLTSLLDNLSLPANHDDQINDVKAFLHNSKDIQYIPKMVAETVNLAMVALGKTQQDLTSYLNQLNSQLASINASIVTSYKSQRTLTNKRHDFNTDLQKQVAETSSAVTVATNLDDLKHVIEERLGTISSTMTDYQKQMQDQEKNASQSISQLRNKVSRMEKDASTLRLNLQQKLAQAMTDSLTNLPNRAAYQDSILPLCQAGQQPASKGLALAVCDIDYFKSVNDTWGHLAGDKVLRLIPRQIRSALSDKDMVFRYGGEEFVILFPDTDLATAHTKAEAVRAAVEKMPFNVQGEPVPITISIGLALLNNESHEGLFDRADKSLYLAKDQGRNKVVIDSGD